MTTGGTGFGVRDTTPEVHKRILLILRDPDAYLCQSRGYIPVTGKGSSWTRASIAVNIYAAYAYGFALEACCWHHWKYLGRHATW